MSRLKSVRWMYLVALGLGAAGLEAGAGRLTWDDCGIPADHPLMAQASKIGTPSQWVEWRNAEARKRAYEGRRRQEEQAGTQSLDMREPWMISRALLWAGGNVHAKNVEGQTPLDIALCVKNDQGKHFLEHAQRGCQCCDAQVKRFLDARQAVLQEQDWRYRLRQRLIDSASLVYRCASSLPDQPVMEAACQAWSEARQLLTDLDKQQKTLVQEFCKPRPDAQTVVAALAAGACVNVPDPQSGTLALSNAIRYGAPGSKGMWANILLDCGANPNVHDQQTGWTPMHCAAALTYRRPPLTLIKLPMALFLHQQLVGIPTEEADRVYAIPEIQNRRRELLAKTGQQPVKSQARDDAVAVGKRNV